MAAHDETALRWRGKQTVDDILGRLVPPIRLEITLPENDNHALFAALNPEANVAQTEALNIEGDVMLLRKVARLRGLEDLTPLVESLSGLATVTVLSPPRIVIVLERSMVPLMWPCQERARWLPSCSCRA